MLSEKPWRGEAVLRLFAGVVICVVFLGAVADAALQWFQHGTGTRNLRLLIGLAGAGGAFAVALFTLSRSWSLENFLRRALWLMGGIYAGLLLIWWSARGHAANAPRENSTIGVVLALLCFQGAALILVWRFLHEHQTGWVEAFALKHRWKRALLFGALAAVTFFCAVLLFQPGIESLVRRLGWEPQEQLAVQALYAAESWGEQLALALVTILVAPVAEEVLFRGILYPAVKQRGFPRLALWGSAAVFAGMHLNVAKFPALMLLALLLTRLYDWTGNLLAPITAHSLFNALNFAIPSVWPWLEDYIERIFHH